ncbi:hypothetical protein EJB05_56989, partial [Eragrostis curvula]
LVPPRHGRRATPPPSPRHGRRTTLPPSPASSAPSAVRSGVLPRPRLPRQPRAPVSFLGLVSPYRRGSRAPHAFFAGLVRVSHLLRRPRLPRAPGLLRRTPSAARALPPSLSAAPHRLDAALRHLLLTRGVVNVAQHNICSCCSFPPCVATNLARIDPYVNAVAMAPDQMFDLNSEPVIEDGDDAYALLDNSFGMPQSVGQVPEVANPDEGHAASEGNNAESAGMTVPTASTMVGAVDVEEGVEVISTPNDPCVGMTFDTCEAKAAKNFYNSYARYKGFSTRIDNSKETKWAGGASRVKYVCHKAGVNKKEKTTTDGPITEKKGDTTRGKAIHKDFTQLHNQNHPGLSAHVRAETFDLFDEMKKQDPDFFYDYTLDKFRRVKHLFWIDGESRRQFPLYNDCISFDTTYCTNKYNMPCAPFIALALKSFRANGNEVAWLLMTLMSCMVMKARSEGFNAVLKRYVSPNNSLFKFVEQYIKIQHTIVGRQNELEFNTTVREPSFLTGHPMEQQMMGTNTRRLFNVFQVELKYTSSYFVRETDTPNVFDIVPYNVCEDPLYHSRTFWVRANPSEEEYECTCCKFSRDGVLCCHILKVFDKLVVRFVPARYIKQRWSMNHDEDGAEPQHEEMLGALGMTDAGKQAVRHHRVCNSFANITRPSVSIDDEYAVIVKHVEALQTELIQMQPLKLIRVEQLRIAHSETGQSVDDIIGVRFDRAFATRLEETILNCADQCCGKEGAHAECNDNTGDNLVPDDTPPIVKAPTVSPKDPPVTKKQGRPKEKRYRGLEFHAKKQKQGRPCGLCESTEHATTSCPSRPQRTSNLASLFGV